MASNRKSPFTGWDSTERHPVDLTTLDLNQSFPEKRPADSGPVGEPAAKKAKKAPNPKWKHKGKTPLVDPKELPPDWTTDEPDLHPYDIDGQIARCHERIRANIMPMIFRQRLKEYELVKADDRAMKKLFPRLKGEVAHRIMSLQRIHGYVDSLHEGDSQQNGRRNKQHEDEDDYQGDDLDEIKRLYQPVLDSGLGSARNEDDYVDLPAQQKARQLENIKAVIRAYRKGRLDWREGYVTYWSKGKQLCRPRPFDWDEFEAIYDRYDGHTSFWTEGIDVPRPQTDLAFLQIKPHPAWQHMNLYWLALRIPGYGWWQELEFLHDTGSGMMQIYRGDIRTIMGPFGPPEQPLPRVLWTTEFHTGANNATREIIELEVTILNSAKERLAPWVRTQVSVRDGDYRPGQSLRTSGPWVRYMMYSGAVPDGRMGLYLADTKNELFNSMPVASPHVRRAPVKSWAAQAAAPGMHVAPTSDAPPEWPNMKRPPPPPAKNAEIPHVYYDA